MAIRTEHHEPDNSPQGRRGRRRGRGQHGAILLESAIGLPILFLLIFGVMEVGLAVKSYSGAANAVGAGGRAGSVAGNDSTADMEILKRVAREAAGIGDGEIEYVVIWHPSGPGATVPSGCLPGTPPAAVNTTSVGVSDGGTGAVGACNVYLRPADTGGAFDMAKGGVLANPPEYYFGCGGFGDAGAGHKVDCNWPGENRVVTTTPRGFTGPVRTPDYVGVFIRAEHSYVTGILGDSLTITDNSINLLEPQGYSVSG